jgi:NhaP-type Na+/H+ or K+/H+ antiporter
MCKKSYYIFMARKVETFETKQIPLQSLLHPLLAYITLFLVGTLLTRLLTPVSSQPFSDKKKSQNPVKSRLLTLSNLIGATGFEPATSASRTQRSTKLSHAPL